LKFDVDKELFPFESHFLKTSNGSDIHYVDEGEGPVILMMHGNPTWSFLYRKMITKLKGHFRCIAPDYPGFGLSIAPEGFDFLASSQSEVMIEVVEKLELKDFIIVMQDLGGPIGLSIAEKFPERVRGLVIGNTWGWPLKDKARFQVFSWLMGGPVGRLMAHSFNGVWRFFMIRGFVDPRSDGEMAMYAAPFRDKKNRKQTSIFPRQLVKAHEFEAQVEAGLDKLSEKPVLFLWGNKDFAFQMPELERFKSHFPNHVCHFLEASHFWQDEQGDVASDFLLDWTAKV
jgi:haloalkane dehalogenase